MSWRTALLAGLATVLLAAGAFTLVVVTHDPPWSPCTDHEVAVGLDLAKVPGRQELVDADIERASMCSIGTDDAGKDEVREAPVGVSIVSTLQEELRDAETPSEECADLSSTLDGIDQLVLETTDGDVWVLVMAPEPAVDGDTTCDTLTLQDGNVRMPAISATLRGLVAH